MCNRPVPKWILRFLCRHNNNHRLRNAMNAKMKERKRRENVSNIIMLLSQCDNHWSTFNKDYNALIRFPVSFLRRKELLLIIVVCTVVDRLSRLNAIWIDVSFVRARFIFFKHTTQTHSKNYESSQHLFDLIPLLKHFEHHSSVQI